MYEENRVFVNRETCIKAFREDITKLGTNERHILFYYGIAGIGKSKLQKEFQRILEEEYPEILWASINLKNTSYRDVGTFLCSLRDEIYMKYDVKFYLFNTIHAIYYKKLHPEIFLREIHYPLINENGPFNIVIDILNKYTKIPVKLLFETINDFPEYIKRFFINNAIDINKLVSMEAYELEKSLPIFFASDFFDKFGKNPKAYIFIDTYESLWAGVRNVGSFHERDGWIRERLIPHLLGVSWIISGREELRWDECSRKPELYIEQHELRELKEDYCDEFLKECGIENKDICDVITKASDGVPFYLNLSVDTYEEIYKKRKPVARDFGGTHQEIYESFVEYLYRNEVVALKVLSVANFWDRNLFNILMKKFDTGLPTSNFSELTRFSFINKDKDAIFSIHHLMRVHLQDDMNRTQDPFNTRDVHEFMFLYYDNKIKEIDIKTINHEHETAFNEAFYHAKEILEYDILFLWFMNILIPFYKAAFFQLLIPMYEDMLNILEKRLDCNYEYILVTLNNLADLYCNVSNHNAAYILYEKALDICRNNTGEDRKRYTAVTLGNFSKFLAEIGQDDDALLYAQEALLICKDVLGLNHPHASKFASTIATIYCRKQNYEDARTFYKLSYNTLKELLDQHDPRVTEVDMANLLANIAVMHKMMKEYDTAFSLCYQALMIYEKTLGLNHPNAIMLLNSVGEFFKEIGEYENALKFFQLALINLQSVPNGNESLTSTITNNINDIRRKVNYIN